MVSPPHPAAAGAGGRRLPGGFSPRHLLRGLLDRHHPGLALGGRFRLIRVNGSLELSDDRLVAPGFALLPAGP